MGLRIQSMLLCFSFFWVGARSSLADDKLEGFDRVILGRAEEGFNYYLISQFVKMQSVLTEVPILATDGSPIYEGVRAGPGEKLRIVSSFANLLSKGRLPNSIRPQTYGPWAEQSIRVILDAATIEKFLGILGKDKRAFQSAAGGLTPDKAKLFYAILFQKRLQFSTRAVESERLLVQPDYDALPTLDALGLTSKNPDPDPTRVPISLSYGFWDHFIEFMLDIYVDSIEIQFAKKTITFDPKTQSIRFQMSAEGAELTGRSHNIGRVRNLSKYVNRFPFFFHDRYVKVKKASIGAFDIDLSFKFEMKESGFWQLELLNKERPLVLRMKDKEPLVNLDIENLPFRSTNLSDRVIKKIEDVLSETVASGLSSSFSPDDFGYRAPVRLPNFERVSDPDRKLGGGPQAELEVRMDKFNFLSDGVEMFLKTRVNRYSSPSCLKNFREDAEPIALSKSSVASSQNSPWQLVSTFEREDQDVKIGSWKAQSVEGSSKGFVDIEVAKEALNQFSLTAALGGLYCSSTRAVWPRPGHTPLIEFRPLSPPQVRMNENQISVNVSGELLSYGRRFESDIDGFHLSSQKHIEATIDANLEPATQKISWKPSELRFSNSPVENDFVQEVLKMIFETFSKTGPDGRSTLGTEVFLSQLTQGKVQFESVKISKDRIQGRLPASNLDRLDWKQNVPIEGEWNDEDLVAPKTERIPETPTEVHFPNIEIRWKPNDRFLFSTRKRKADEAKWGDWSPFQRGDHESISLGAAGRYYVQVKAMNRGFEIEETPVQYEFYYDAPLQSLDLLNRNPKDDANPSQKSEGDPLQSEKNHPIEAAPPDSLPSKGIFGCSLDVSGQQANSKIFWDILGLFAVFALGWQGLRLRVLAASLRSLKKIRCS